MFSITFLIVLIRPTHAVENNADSYQVDISQELKNIIFRKTYNRSTRITLESESNNFTLGNNNITINTNNDPIPNQSNSINKEPENLSEHNDTEDYETNQTCTDSEPSQTDPDNSMFNNYPDVDLMVDTVNPDQGLTEDENNDLDQNTLPGNEHDVDNLSQNVHDGNNRDEPNNPDNNSVCQDVATYTDKEHFMEKSNEEPILHHSNEEIQPDGEEVSIYETYPNHQVYQSTLNNSDNVLSQDESSEKARLTETVELQQPIGSRLNYPDHKNRNYLTTQRSTPLPYSVYEDVSAAHSRAEAKTLEDNNNDDYKNSTCNINTDCQDDHPHSSDINESSYLHNSEDQIASQNTNEEVNKSDDSNVAAENVIDDNKKFDVKFPPKDTDDVVFEQDSNTVATHDTTIAKKLYDEDFRNIREEPVPNIYDKKFRLAYMMGEQEEHENYIESE